MKVSDLMEAMSQAGAPMEAILLAVRALEDRDAVLEQKRAVERDRKRRQRAKDKTEIEGVTVTGPSRDTDGTVTDNSLPLPPNENNSNPPTPTHEKQTPRARKGTRLPADWMPKPLSEPLATAVAQWPPGALDRELERLRDWAASATGTNAVKSDWDAAWRNWIRKIEDEGRYGNASNRNSTQQGNIRSFGKPKDGAIAALDRRLGLDGGPGTYRADDAGAGQADRPVALAGPRRLFG